MMYTNEDFRPGGIHRDVIVERIPARDPDGWFYKPDRRWVLVKTQEALETGRYPAWDHTTVAVITYEIASTCRWVIAWRTTGASVLYVQTEDVAGIPEGEVLGDLRFTLHDHADHRILRMRLGMERQRESFYVPRGP